MRALTQTDAKAAYAEALALAGVKRERELADPGGVVDVLRELAEWRRTAEAVAAARPGDLVLVDGSLHPGPFLPAGLVEPVHELAREREVDLVGVTKASKLRWGRYAPLVLRVRRRAEDELGPDARWYLRVTRPEEPSEVYVARLARAGAYAFRVDAVRGAPRPRPAVRGPGRAVGRPGVPRLPLPAGRRPPGGVAARPAPGRPAPRPARGVPARGAVRGRRRPGDARLPPDPERLSPTTGHTGPCRTTRDASSDGPCSTRFRAFYGEDLFLGELLAGDDPERGRRYLFRVTDVAYGSESSDAGWAERTAGGLMAMDTVGEATTLRDFEKRLYKVAEVVPLGYVDAKGFHKPKSLPAQFAAVSAPTDADLAFLRERMGDVEVGRLRSGEDTIDLPVGIRRDPAQPRRRVRHHRHGQEQPDEGPGRPAPGGRGRYAMLLFDPHGEYLEAAAGRRGLAHHPWAPQRLRVYSPSPRAGQASLLRLSLAELTVDDLRTAWKFTGPSPRPWRAPTPCSATRGWLTRLAEEDPRSSRTPSWAATPWPPSRSCPGGPSGSCACR